ncbi:putative (S)-N-methylcoclaurine 3'-hydroxylase isozyme 2 [Wolffia australiana]
MENWQFFFLALLPLLVFLINRATSKQPNLPPGPRPWPIIGNLPHLLLRQVASKQRLHAALAAIADDHGPFFHLRLGAWNLLVASSPASASQVLKSSDRALCGRYVPSPYRIPEFSLLSFIWNTDADEEWRFLRTLVKTHLLSLPSLSRHGPGRKKKALHMAEFLHRRAGEQVLIGKMVFATLFNSITEMIFSRDVLSLEDGQGSFPELKKHMARILEFGARPSLEDFFPSLAKSVDADPRKREVKIYLNKVYDIWDEILLKRGKNEGEEDLAEVLQRSGVSYTQLKVVILELLTAGTDTSTALVEWVMSELLRNSEIMNRVKSELREVMGENQGLVVPDETQLSRLTFLHACVRESLRLHPPVPLLLPHRSITNCEVMGFTVPKDYTVMVNVWAIGRDPAIWENPLKFSPERFISGDVDYKGGKFEFIPFGAGLRMCPGMALGMGMVQLVVATMVYNFDWVLPGEKPPCQINMEEKLGIVLERREPLVLIPRPLR